MMMLSEVCFLSFNTTRSSFQLLVVTGYCCILPVAQADLKYCCHLRWLENLFGLIFFLETALQLPYNRRSGMICSTFIVGSSLPLQHPGSKTLRTYTHLLTQSFETGNSVVI